jgi:hypothetical protein
MGPVAQLVFKTSAVVQPTARSVRLRRRSVSGDRYALLVEPLSPELALVDPELAERARAQLVEGRSPEEEAARLRQPEPRPPRLSTPEGADRTERPKVKRRSRGKGTAIVAAIAVAAVLGAASAIWARYDGDSSSVRKSERLTTRPQNGTPATTATSSGQATTRSRQGGSGSAPRRALRPPRRPPAFHVPGAPKEPLDEITLPARARRLEAWWTPGRSLTEANLRHWLYQHAWIVTGARFGWWHGAEALRTLIRLDRRVEVRWAIGHRSEAAARQALAEVEARTK